MKWTIVPDDKMIYVDGVARKVLNVAFPDGVHAVQWYGTYGEIEYKMDDTGHKRENERFTDVSRFAPLLREHKKA